MTIPAIFLDRDGVLNENRVDHVKSWDEFRFVPGVLPALRSLARSACPIVIVTNQAIVHRGDVSQHNVDAIHRRMRAEITRSGGRIDGIYCCPHTPEEGCDCRKPEPGLLLQAARDFSIDLPNSVFVGDALTDIQAGKKLGCRTILVRTGRGRAALEQLGTSALDWPDDIASDLPGAIPSISKFLSTGRQRYLPVASVQRERTYERPTAVELAADLADAAFGS